MTNRTAELVERLASRSAQSTGSRRRSSDENGRACSAYRSPGLWLCAWVNPYLDRLPWAVKLVSFLVLEALRVRQVRWSPGSSLLGIAPGMLGVPVP